MQYMQLNQISSYRIAFHLSNEVWNIVLSWDWLAKDTVGKQFVRSVDSISANIAEGFGRYGKRDRIKFYRYSAASVREALDWNEKARIRNLLTTEEYNYTYQQLQLLPKDINSLIKYTNERLPD